jgi:bifunctional DNA-binding transcriptional regulator/antitoxin component of YhaV-PrlF toxin-antitoxin module
MFPQGKAIIGYRITEKGTVTIPVNARAQTRPGVKGSQVDFVTTGDGLLIVPAIPFLRVSDHI